MRWQALFSDLEGQAEAWDRAELDAEVRDRTRRETALVLAVDRLRASTGGPVVLTVAGAGRVTGRLASAGAQWLLLEEAGGREVLVPWAAVLAVGGVGRQVEPPEGAVGRRLDLRWALRGLARDRAAVQVVLTDGSSLAGTVDRVGADHLDLAEHDPGEARRAGAVTGVRLVPLHALALLRQV